METISPLSITSEPMIFAEAGEPDPVQAATIILRAYGARAISLITAPHIQDGGHALPSRLSANDCYVALDEACRKVARVALRRWRQAGAAGRFADALPALFPDPTAYVARAIKSVISDAARNARRDVPTISLDRPIGGEDDCPLSLADTIAETRHDLLPEDALLEQDERARFRAALKQAFRTIPANYLVALRRDLLRERNRKAGEARTPESDRERQTVCRARAALAQILKREAGSDNPYVQILAQQRSSRVRQKAQPTPSWTGERQEALFRRILETPWAARSQADSGDSVEEAIVNDVTATTSAAPPSPELRQAMRVLDLYTVDRPVPSSEVARSIYDEARTLRKAGKIEEALHAYRRTYEAEPTFIAALNEVGVMFSQLGNLRDALHVYLSIIERYPSSEHCYIAATNAADIYLTWYDAGRNRERNIALAQQYAKLAMEHPRPMRACNLILAYVKDRYYEDARSVLQQIVETNAPECPAEKFLQTVFQIRDTDLIAWWNWLEQHMTKEQQGS